MLKFLLAIVLLVGTYGILLGIPSPIEAQDAIVATPAAHVETPVPVVTPSVPSVTPAVTPAGVAGQPESVEDATALLTEALKAARGGNWPMCVGILLVLAGWVVRKFKLLATQIPPNAVKWVTPAVAIGVAAGGSLMSGVAWTDVLINSGATILTAGLAVLTGAPKPTA